MAQQAQPYRAATAGRHESNALRAMSAGRGPLNYGSPGQARRAASKKRRGKRKSRARYKSPLHRVLAMRRANY